MKKASFRVVHFPRIDKYIAMAWNYNLAVLISTKDHDTYTLARAELDQLCAETDVKLQWFDGEYTCDGEGRLFVPADLTTTIARA